MENPAFSSNTSISAEILKEKAAEVNSPASLGSPLTRLDMNILSSSSSFCRVRAFARRGKTRSAVKITFHFPFCMSQEIMIFTPLSNLPVSTANQRAHHFQVFEAIPT